MLVQLKIKDFAIIDDVDITFNEGMTVLTGETGSGKSIIIDAINLLTGDRAQSDMVRHDKEKAIIEGAFHYSNDKIAHLLQEFGIEEEELLIIYREISKKGRNICRLNGHLITVSQLKQIGNYLVDIHVQHDTTQLIQTNNYLYIIDSLADDQFHELKENYQTTYQSYKELVKTYRQLLKDNQANKERIDFYRFQYEELKQAELDIDDYNELVNKRNMIANYDKIYESLNLANSSIKDQHVLENIYQASQQLNKIENVNETYKQLSEQLLNIYYQLEDTANELSDAALSLDYNPQELDQIETRLSIYSQLKRKYKMEVEELIEKRDELLNKINSIDHFDDLIYDLKTKLNRQFEQVIKEAKQLRKERMTLCESIKNELLTHLADLKLSNTTFDVIFNPIDEKQLDILNDEIFNEDGFDEVDFHLSFNKGEPTKPLARVASGGELSRFMLALKTVLMQKQQLATMIFDEIDTGVSGITASAIARKIKAISESIQVLCITHLPHVASIADHHLNIVKKELVDRTKTEVYPLTNDERVHEIAKMMSGDNLNEFAIENAKKLLKQ